MLGSLDVEDVESLEDIGNVEYLENIGILKEA
jgi:hypothetical protein